MSLQLQFGTVTLKKGSVELFPKITVAVALKKGFRIKNVMISKRMVVGHQSVPCHRCSAGSCRAMAPYRNSNSVQGLADMT